MQMMVREVGLGEDESEWPLVPVLPSYGRGRDAHAGRFSSLIFGTNLTDVVITGNNSTIDGPGASWWKKFKAGQLNETRSYMIENVTYSARLEGIPNDPFKGICISNVTITLTVKPKKLQWNCTDIAGVTSDVTPKACDLMPEKKEVVDCPFPEDRLAIEDVKLVTCSASLPFF
ncbi:hypothetical protein CerSpe_121390 [Prunus speciosa]